MVELLFLVVCLVAVFTLAMREAPLWLWTVCAAVLLLLWQSGIFQGINGAGGIGFWSLLAWLPILAAAALTVEGIRRPILIKPVFAMVKKILPKVSDTEQAALDAGTVGFDAQLFSGKPDWAELRAVPPVILSSEEQAFMDGPTEELCEMVDDWAIRHNNREVPDEIWEFVGRHGFLGMLISKEHGGLGFSAQAQSLILGKISSRSPDVATVVMVPNSLGPGELIEKYGTDEQKHHFLPRLAKGKEIPCFALTGPTSGSDAATMRDIGYVTRGTHDGKDVLGVRLSWDKRYITLGPKATLLGLAFELFDPDKLLGDEVERDGDQIGITLALIPATHPGVNIGRRHLPGGSAFPNGPNSGTDVFIPIEWIIGGEKMVGQGWLMLMECLSAGRAISLPASGAAGTKAMLRFTSAYGRIRKQFGLPVAKMEGIEEPLARLVEGAYVNEAARAATAAMVSRGEKPAVISALMKYNATERLRQAVNDAMDIHGGRGICDGPSNYLQSAYQMVPVGITVEGANILTRSLITFSQGALRSHPYLYKQVQAAQNEDAAAGLNDFDGAFRGHIAYGVSNFFGAFFHNFTGGLFGNVPEKAYGTAEYYRQLWRSSRNFAFVADLTIALLGGDMKRKQKLTGRMADALSELYMLACMLKRFEDDGKPSADRDILAFCAQNSLYRFQRALRGTIENFPVTWARVLMRSVVYPLGSHYHPANDKLGGKIAAAVLAPGDVRDRLTRSIYVSNDVNDPTGLLEVTLLKVVEAEAAEKKLEKAIKAGTVRRFHGLDWIGEARDKNVLTESEAQLLREVDKLVARVIAVDHFDPAELKPNYVSLGHNSKTMDQSAAAAE